MPSYPVITSGSARRPRGDVLRIVPVVQPDAKLPDESLPLSLSLAEAAKIAHRAINRAETGGSHLVVGHVSDDSVPHRPTELEQLRQELQELREALRELNARLNQTLKVTPKSRFVR